jgi:hypothetical protein
MEETGVPILGENPDLLHVTDKLSHNGVYISPWNMIGIDLFVPMLTFHYMLKNELPENDTTVLLLNLNL